jgi:hypothetical protein
MQSVSNVLYEMAVAQSQEELDNSKQRCFVWIWHWLLMFQPSDVWKKELTLLESTDKFSGLKPTFIQELAWKAEALESLLASES